MTFVEILLLALGVSLDAAVVAVGAGALGRMSVKTALKVALFFGGFQALMPLLGFLLGYGFRDYLLSYGHIIGFVLLMLVGGKMLLEAFEKDDESEEREISHTPVLLVLAFATSIDALVVGITFSFVAVNVPLALATIGIVTFLMALAGAYVGTRGKDLFGKRIEIVGALILFAIAFKILLFS